VHKTRSDKNKCITAVPYMQTREGNKQASKKERKNQTNKWQTNST